MSVLINTKEKGRLKMSKLPIERLLNDHVLTIGGVEYPLRRVSEEELLSLRIANNPGVVFCCKSELWYSELPSMKVKLNGEKWLEHVCSREKECCSHLSALPESEGGCRCVRDTNAHYYMAHGYNKKQAYIRSFRIEKYDFLVYAIESFGTTENGFKALKCKNVYYEVSKPVQVDVELQKQRIIQLAQHLNPDIQSLADIYNKF